MLPAIAIAGRAAALAGGCGGVGVTAAAAAATATTRRCWQQLRCSGLSTTAAARAAAAVEPHKQEYKVGVVGLGRIGAIFVPRLLDAGRDVVVHDANPLAVARALEAGASHRAGGAAVTAASSPQELAETDGVGAVVTVVSDPSALRDVFEGPKGLLAARGGVRPSLFVNVSTVDPDTVRALAERVARAELHPSAAAAGGLAAAPETASGRPTLLDAPATGGVVGARAGDLCFSVGAADGRDVEAARPILSALGAHVAHCGGVGAGSVAKLCNTLVMSASMVAVAEALALGKRLGVDPAVLTDVLLSGSGRCWAAERYNPVPGIVRGAPASQGYRPGQEVDQVRDQLRMLIAAGDRVHSPTPAAEFCEKEYAVLHDEGLGGKDFSAVYRYRYGSGCDNPEWKEGQQLFSAQVP